MFTLTFTDRDMAVLNAALGALPYRDVAPLIASINRQLTPPPAQDDDEKPGESGDPA